MSKTAVTSLHKHYILGLLSGAKSLSDMSERGLLPFGKQYCCKLLAGDPTPHRQALEKRLDEAPQGAYLTIDLLKVKHQGERLEGVSRHYDSNTKALDWGHTLVSSGLVAPEMDPYLLRADPFMDALMSTPLYPELTASEAMLTVVGDVVMAGYQAKGVLVDAEFTTRLALRSLKQLTLPLVGRFRTTAKVLYEAQKVRVRELAERFLPGKAHWYPKLKRYVKRLEVVIEEVGVVDLIIIWKGQGTGWDLTVLISTLKAGVQEVVRAWLLHWGLESSHRLRKQNLALGACQCFAFAAQLQHAELVIDAFNLMRAERQANPACSWKEAQKRAAKNLKHALLTEQTLMVA